MKKKYIVIDHELHFSYSCNSQDEVKESIFPDEDDRKDQSWEDFIKEVEELDTYEIIGIECHESASIDWVVGVSSQYKGNSLLS